MKLQKITQKRWFWPLVCAVSVVFGWWYLSIVTCAPLGGDDELINLQNYYYITHTSFGQSVLDYLGDLWEQFSLQNGRFRPFSSPPVRGLTSWFLGDLVGYRLYILAWTYADIVLTAWLVGKASRNKKLGIACLCLLPMMFSVWQDSTGNSLYSYGALVQSTLLPALVAGLAVLRWQDTGHKRWAVLAGYCMFQCCATFEIGFTYIVPIFGLAWLYTDKARDALRLSIPALLGECVTLAFNMGARLMNTLRAAGILAGSVSQIEGISPNFDLPAILRTWAMQMSAGFPLNAMLFGKMRPGKIYPVDVLCGVMVAGAAVAALAALDKLPNKKQNLLLFLSGLAMLSAPALLIGLSPKYQQPGQVDWRHGYIPQTVESFGVGLMALAVLVLIGYCYLHRWDYNALLSGEETALSLGIHVRRLTLTNVVLTCFVCSVIVSHVGLINFIGLVAPHIVRMVVGNNYIYLIPGSVLAGAALLLLSDLAARVIIMPVILPIGALTAFLGGPLFLYLLFKGRGRT